MLINKKNIEPTSTNEENEGGPCFIGLRSGVMNKANPTIWPATYTRVSFKNKEASPQSGLEQTNNSPPGTEQTDELSTSNNENMKEKKKNKKKEANFKANFDEV